MAETHAGSCLCGAVRIEASAAPKWVANCHCRDCQKATGAAFATYAGFEAGQVTVAGEGAIDRETSPGVHRVFCGVCGSPISYRSDKWPGEVHLFTALLDDVDALTPMLHVQMADAVPWLHLGDGLPQYQHFPSDGDGDGDDSVEEGT